MSKVKTSGPRTGQYILSEDSQNRSRDEIMLDGDGKVLPCTVLGIRAATADAPAAFVPLDPTADDGSAIAAGILYEGRDLTDAEAAVEAVATVRASQVKRMELIWPVDATAEIIASGENDLKDIGVIVR